MALCVLAFCGCGESDREEARAKEKAFQDGRREAAGVARDQKFKEERRLVAFVGAAAKVQHQAQICEIQRMGWARAAQDLGRTHNPGEVALAEMALAAKKKDLEAAEAKLGAEVEKMRINAPDETVLNRALNELEHYQSRAHTSLMSYLSVRKSNLEGVASMEDRDATQKEHYSVIEDEILEWVEEVERRR